MMFTTHHTQLQRESVLWLTLETARLQAWPTLRTTMAAQHRYRIRDFVPADDAGCKALELSGGFVTPKNPIGKRLIQGGFTHAKQFDAKATQFPVSHVIVCEDTTPPPGAPHIVGVVMLGIKQVMLQGRQITLGYTFDLRVHGEAQRCGIGLMLCNEVERRNVAAGVNTSYLSVNGDNHRAKKLYAKLGYVLASYRAPKMDLLVSSVAVWEDAQVADLAVHTTIVELAPKDAVETLVTSHGGRDCALTADGVEQLLLHHPAYEASYVATFTNPTDGMRSSASIHLWNASHLGGFKLTRLLLPTRWLDAPALGATVGAGVAACAALYGRWAWRMAHEGHTVTAVCAALCGALVLFGVKKAAPTANFIRRVLVNSNYPERRGRLRARLFGAASSGPRGVDVLSGLVRHARNEARAKGFEMLVLNMDADDPARKALGKAAFYTEFYQKRIDDTNHTNAPQRFDPQAFHDPRDIS